MRQYNVTITIPNVDFNSYLPDLNIFPDSFEAELTIVENEKIELLILLGNIANNSHKLGFWMQEVGMSGLGKYIFLKDVEQNEDVLEINFKNANLLSGSFESGEELVRMKFDSVAITTHHAAIEYKAYLSLDNVGLKFIEMFYGGFWYKGNEIFENLRMKNAKERYDGYECTIKPLFNYRYSNRESGPEINILKLPSLNFEFNENENFEIASKKIDSVISVISFFMNNKLSYYTSVIHLKHIRVTTYKISEKRKTSTNISFNNFGVKWLPEQLFEKAWHKNAFEYYSILHKIIDLFIQASVVDDRTKLLIRYNIIEICMGKFKLDTESFKFKNTSEAVFKNALDSMLQDINDEDKEAFINKWKGISTKLNYKPMKSPLNEFFKSKNIPVDNLPIKLNKIKELRDDIIHGSLDINVQSLKHVNILLYRLTGILILDLLGITEWEMKMYLPKTINHKA